MNQERINYLKNRLEEMRDSLTKNLKNNNTGESIKESTGELSSYDNHPADQASNTFELEKETGVQDNELLLLKKVEKALHILNFENEQFGKCQKCGEFIDQERMEALPYTLVCRGCMPKETEQEYDSKEDRPVEEEVFENFKATTPEDEMIFDGEDTLEELMED